MNVSNEQQVIEEAIVRALRATRANDAETAPARHPRQTPQCPSIARFAAVYKAGAKWSDDEFAHQKAGCEFCQSVHRLFSDALTAASREDTVTNMNSNEETQIGLVPPAKKPHPSPRPNPPSGA
jgi:hypothetical protein